MVLCVVNLIFGITSFVNDLTYLSGTATVFAVGSFMLPIILAMPIIALVRILNKPYKYWIQLGVNSIALSLFAFNFLRGFFSVLSISLYTYSDFEIVYAVTSIVYNIWLIVFSVIFLVLGIIASTLMMKRKKACDVLYIVIIALSFFLYVLMFSIGGGYKPSGSGIVLIFLMLFELALAIVNAVERESIEELNEFLNAIEHRYKKVYASISKYLDARQADMNNVSKKTTKDKDANDNQPDDSGFEEKIWEERGMIFSNKE